MIRTHKVVGIKMPSNDGCILVPDPVDMLGIWVKRKFGG
jgi:hypothetical protein